MPDCFEERLPIKEFALWNKARKAKNLLMFNFELTARCNFNCRHCYINLPSGDASALAKELTFAQIKEIIDQAVEAGAVYCVLTGGEPLLRKDFLSIYEYLRRKGVKASLFTNASLVTPAIAQLLSDIPPFIIEVTVYGVTKETYEKITRLPGSFVAFQRGLDILKSFKLPVRLKAMIMRANLPEFETIIDFCRKNTYDKVRFDPFLHLRYDGNSFRNEEISSERLSPEEIVAIEQRVEEHFSRMRCMRDKIILPEQQECDNKGIFRCAINSESFTVNFEGYLQPCSALCQPPWQERTSGRDLRTLINELIERTRSQRTENPELCQRCLSCRYLNFCMWCPANAFLETGKADQFVQYFCDVAKARASALYQEGQLPQPAVTRS